MKRYGNLYPQVTEFANLLNAAAKARRGHQYRPAVARFSFHLESELFRLQAELRNHAYQPQPYHVFTIHEPKQRQICAAPIRDRVVHHAICNIAGPIWESALIGDTFACRAGKGQHAAVLRAQHFARRHRYFLQGDIAQYFASIDHERLKELLRRKIKDGALLGLIDRIIDQPLAAAPPGKGLPIGNLTSQYFANLYLGQLDHFVKERRRVAGYLRYMDDFLLFGNDKTELRQHLAALRDFLRQDLALSLKEAGTVLAPCAAGFSFLGFRVFPAVLRLTGKQWRRFRRKASRLEKDFVAGQRATTDLTVSMRGLVAHSAHADTLQARRQFFANSAVSCYF